MQPGDGSSNDGRRRQTGFRPGFGAGFPPGFGVGFPDFPDPFAGFGSRSNRSLLDDFFTRDPFDDPFFSRPFGSMFGSMGGLLGGSSGFFGPRGFFEDDGLFNRSSQNGLLDQRAFNPPPETRRGPVIEELPDDHEATENHPRHSQEPIVEHPDDEIAPTRSVVEAADTGRQSRYQMPQGQRFGNQGNRGYQTYSFQSSSVTYGGPEGTYYTTSSTQRKGADGVTEEEHLEKDSRSGTEVKKTARGVGEKVHAFTRKRNAAGEENTLETLHNLTEGEATQFDREWEKRAARSLPKWNKGNSEMLEGNRSGSTSQARLLLPSNEGICDGSHPPKKLLKN